MKKKLLTIPKSNDTTTQDSDTISLEDIISLLPGSIYWKDREGRYLGCNPYAAAIGNFKSPTDVIGKKLSDIFALEIASPVERHDLEVMNSGIARRYEEIGVSNDNKKAIFLSEKLPIHNKNGKVIGLVGVSFDITERKQMEEALKQAKEKAEESDLAKSRFLAVVNHELRTPLTSILGLLSFLKQGNLSDQEQKDITHTMENCTNHLLGLVENVLEFSTLEVSQPNLQSSPVNLNMLLLETYNMLKPLAHAKQLELVLNATHLSYDVLTHSHLLRQIFVNLATNAIKFTDKGSITIQLQPILYSQEKMKLRVDFCDTGIGIPADKLEVIFEPFHQLNHAYTKQSSLNGAGLGLAIVKKLAGLIQAEIKVVSQVGVGSTFSFEAQFNVVKTVKKKRVPREDTALQAEKMAEIRAYRPLILVVEDDSTIQYIHHKILQDLGCAVEVASCGKEALKKLNQHHIVIVDISLPDISGFEVIKAIRKHPIAHRAYVIALTAYIGKAERSACLNAGADLFKSKPVSSDAFKKILLRLHKINYLSPKAR